MLKLQTRATLSLSLVLCLLALPYARASAQESRPAPPIATFKPSVKRVAVFKNGYVFTYREGVAAPSNGWVYTTEVPTGVLGTVWGYTTNSQARVTQLLASEADKRDSARVANLEELLFVNEGTRIRVKSQYSDKVLEGTYVVLHPRRTFAVGRSDAPLMATGAEVIPNGQSDIAVTTETGVAVIRTSNIAHLEFVGQPRWEKLAGGKENRLGFKLDGATPGQSIGVGLAALERGIRWIPAYRIEPVGEPVTEARMELEAMVINDLADLADAEIYFVVGVPHFLYQDLLSPLSLNQTFAGVSSYFNVSSSQFSNAIMTQSRAGELRQSGGAREGGDPYSSVPGDASLPAMSADELYLYRSDQVALKKGERASLRLFAVTVPCREVFNWEIPEGVTSDEYESRSLANLSGGFWRSLKLTNRTGMPWTTAPAIAFRDWKPLGQDILAFTPVNTETLVRVTPATEVVGTHKLTEKGRVPQAMKTGRVDNETVYDLLTIEGTVKLRNVKKHPVDVIVTRRVLGTVRSASDAGAISRDGGAQQAVNPNSTVRWELSLPPGERELRYTYQVYVAR